MRALACLFLVCALVPAATAVTFPLFSAGDNGGGTCAGCTIVVGLIEQLAALDNQTIDHEVANLCKRFPSNLQKLCTTLIDLFGPCEWLAPENSPCSHYHAP
jgi:acyloxyacyl hydrolase